MDLCFSCWCFGVREEQTDLEGVSSVVESGELFVFIFRVDFRQGADQ